MGAAAPPSDLGLEVHPMDAEVLAKAMELANQKREELSAAGVAPSMPVPAGEFAGFQLPPASWPIGHDLIVTRSDGSESACRINSVFLTALGPQYEVYLGDAEDGTHIMKWVQDSDLRAFP